MQRALQLVLPVVNRGWNRTLPATVGDCEGVGLPELPPKPCLDVAPIYPSHLDQSRIPSPSTSPDVIVRWLTGVNTFRVSEAKLHSAAISPKAVWIDVRGVLAHLHMSARVQQCIATVCSIVWDSTSACCEAHRTLSFRLKTRCIDSPDGPSELTNFTVEAFHIDNMDVS